MGKQGRWLGRHNCLSTQCSRCERASHSAPRLCLPLDSARCVGLVCQTLGEKRERERGRIGEWQVRGWSFSRGLWCGPSHVILLIKDSSFSSCTCQPYYRYFCDLLPWRPVHWQTIRFAWQNRQKLVNLLMIDLEEKELFKQIYFVEIYLHIYVNLLCSSTISCIKKLF